MGKCPVEFSSGVPHVSKPQVGGQTQLIVYHRRHVQTPIVYHRRHVQTQLIVYHRRHVQTPIVYHRRHVQTPIVYHRWHVLTPIVYDRRHVQTPIVYHRRHVLTPIVYHRRHVLTPIVYHRRHVLTPIVYDRRHVQTPIVYHRRHVQTPIVYHRRHVQTQLIVYHRWHVQTPIVYHRRHVLTPVVYDRRHVQTQLIPEDMFVCDINEQDISGPPASKKLKKSQCTPLFMNAYTMRGAGAVIHTHSKAAVMATLLFPGREFKITHQEMIKGIRKCTSGGYYRYDDVLVVPIIENTPEEKDLKERMAHAMNEYPDSCATFLFMYTSPHALSEKLIVYAYNFRSFMLELFSTNNINKSTLDQENAIWGAVTASVLRERGKKKSQLHCGPENREATEMRKTAQVRRKHYYALPSHSTHVTVSQILTIHIPIPLTTQCTQQEATLTANHLPIFCLYDCDNPQYQYLLVLPVRRLTHGMESTWCRSSERHSSGVKRTRKKFPQCRPPPHLASCDEWVKREDVNNFSWLTLCGTSSSMESSPDAAGVHLLYFLIITMKTAPFLPFLFLRFISQEYRFNWYFSSMLYFVKCCMALKRK
ncbi:hypothetical protein STEG23_003863, partial [Scotinomys teguina]